MTKPDAKDTFQERENQWLLACFGDDYNEREDSKRERNYRFLEEALELVQACGCTREEAMQLVNYVFSRPIGEPFQEVGGTMTTLAALCNIQGLDMWDAGNAELSLNWTKIEQIRAKQAAKPKHSPLPAQPNVQAVERVKFTYRNGGATGLTSGYGCNLPGDQDGEYVRAKDYEALLAQNAALKDEVEKQQETQECPLCEGEGRVNCREEICPLCAAKGKVSRVEAQAGEIAELRKAINAALRCLQNDHVLNNKHRLGALGSQDIQTAIEWLEDAK